MLLTIIIQSRVYSKEPQEGIWRVTQARLLTMNLHSRFSLTTPPQINTILERVILRQS